MRTMSTATNTGFFGAIDPRLLNTLPVGAVIDVTYDELGARRPARYRTIRGTVRRVLESSDRGPGFLSLEQARITHPGGEVTTKASTRLDTQNVMGVIVLEPLGF